MIEAEQKPAHWRSTKLLAASVLAALIGCFLVLLPAISLLDAFTFYGFPFPVGFYLLAQGLLIGLVIAAFWFAIRQERIDRRHGAMEDM